MMLEIGKYVSCKLHNKLIIAVVGEGWDDFIVLFLNYKDPDVAMYINAQPNKIHPENGFEYQYVTNLHIGDDTNDYCGFLSEFKVFDNKNLMMAE